MTETRTQEESPQVAPPAQPIATASKRETWEIFRDELDKRADEIGSQLPPNLPRDRFIGAALAAVKSNPDILKATPRSLMAALTKAAQDGLLPDGREGIITVFNTKVDGTYQNVAQWNPMFYGIRKRARELDDIIIDAQVVIEGDEFDYSLGDSPHITHKPTARTEQVDASKGIAVYAIFRHPQQGILHREVMWKPEVFAVMNQSRAKDSLMWTKFWTEGWRKTVGRRGSKSVPVSPSLERLIQRDDENFSFDRPAPAIPKPSDALPEIPADDVKETAHPVGTEKLTSPPDLDAYFARVEEELAPHETEDDVLAAWQTLGVEAALEGNEAALDRAEAIRRKHIERVTPKAEPTTQGDLLGLPEIPE